MSQQQNTRQHTRLTPQLNTRNDLTIIEDSKRNEKILGKAPEKESERDINKKETKGTIFNQELQWRILNLLTQQLFDNNYESVTSMLFSKNWTYATTTFSVSISSNDTEFYQVNIVDRKHGNETQLAVPHL